MATDHGAFNPKIVSDEIVLAHLALDRDFLLFVECLKDFLFKHPKSRIGFAFVPLIQRADSVFNNGRFGAICSTVHEF